MLNTQQRQMLFLSQSGENLKYLNIDPTMWLQQSTPPFTSDVVDTFPLQMQNPSPLSYEINSYMVQSMGASGDFSPHSSPSSSPPSDDILATSYTNNVPMYSMPSTAGYTGIEGDFLAEGMIHPTLLPEIERLLTAPPSSFQDSSPATPPSPLSDGSSSSSSSASTSRKRPRVEEEVPANSEILLHREQLLNMSSKEIEAYVSQLKSKRALSVGEEKELKRQRRLIKNREYASQSRNRKKKYMDDIEKQLDKVKEENQHLKSLTTSLTEENKLLKRQLECIASTVRKGQNKLSVSASSVISSSMPMHSVLSQVSSGQHVQHQQNLQAQINMQHQPQTSYERLMSATRLHSTSHSMGVAKTAACLMAILFMVFTFGAMWTNETPLPSEIFPNQNGFHYNSRMLQEVMTDKFSTNTEEDMFPPPHILHRHTRPTSSSPTYDLIETVREGASPSASPSSSSSNQILANNETSDFPSLQTTGDISNSTCKDQHLSIIFTPYLENYCSSIV